MICEQCKRTILGGVIPVEVVDINGRKKGEVYYCEPCMAEMQKRRGGQ